MRPAAMPGPESSDTPPTPADDSIHSDREIVVVNAPVAEVYARCMEIENLPRFITSIREVHRLTDTRFACTSVIEGHERESVVQIVLRVPGRRIAWLAMSEQSQAGVASFEPLSERSTRVTVKVRSAAEAVGFAGSLREYLLNFKHFVEQEPARQ